MTYILATGYHCQRCYKQPILTKHPPPHFGYALACECSPKHICAGKTQFEAEKKWIQYVKDTTEPATLGRPPAQDEPKTEQVTIRLTPHAYGWLKARQPSASEWIEEMSRQ